MSENPPRPPDESTDQYKLDFKACDVEEHRRQEVQPAKPVSEDSVPAPPRVPGTSYQIQWNDDELPPEQGGFFAHPGPEPPPQPFEVVREPRSRVRHHARAVPDSQPVAAPSAGFEAAALSPKQESSPRPRLYVRLFWGLLPVFLLLAGYASVVLTQSGVGYAWDEAYYYQPAELASEWMLDVLRGQAPFDRESINYYWSPLHEHPSLQKLLSGIAMQIFEDPQQRIWAMRWPMAILFGLSLTLVYMLGRWAWGPLPGLIAAVAMATMPRIFGHAHFASLETPLIFMTLLTVYCFLRGLEGWHWAVATGIAFGILLATKINGFFLPIPLVLWAHMYARKRYVNNLFAMLTLGPLVFVLAWPWLWHDTANRLLDYLQFHVQHQQTAVWFMGRKWGYGDANAPWYYPFVMTAVTLPLSVLLLALGGALRTFLRAHRRPYGSLFLLCAVVMLLVAAAPATPKYDGVRLFLPVFPFIALLAATGGVGLIRRLLLLMERGGRPITERRWRMYAWSIVVIILLEGATALWRYHPYYLSYYGPHVGGLRGADKLGFEVTYWGEAVNKDVLETLNALPSGTTILPRALHMLALQQQQDLGLLDDHLVLVNEPPADVHLVLMRRGFLGPNVDRFLTRDNRFLIQGWGRWGVPLVGLYDTGPEFQQALIESSRPQQ